MVKSVKWEKGRRGKRPVADNTRMHYLPPPHLVTGRTRLWQALWKAPCWNENQGHNTMAQFPQVWQRIHRSALREWGFLVELSVHSQRAERPPLWTGFRFNYSGNFKARKSKVLSILIKMNLWAEQDLWLVSNKKPNPLLPTGVKLD